MLLLLWQYGKTISSLIQLVVVVVLFYALSCALSVLSLYLCAKFEAKIKPGVGKSAQNSGMVAEKQQLERLNDVICLGIGMNSGKIELVYIGVQINQWNTNHGHDCKCFLHSSFFVCFVVVVFFSCFVLFFVGISFYSVLNNFSQFSQSIFTSTVGSKYFKISISPSKSRLALLFVPLCWPIKHICRAGYIADIVRGHYQTH